LVLFSAIAIILLGDLTIGDYKSARANAAMSQNSSLNTNNKYFISIPFVSFNNIRKTDAVPMRGRFTRHALPFGGFTRRLSGGLARPALPFGGRSSG